MLDACCESLFCVSTEARKRKPNNWFRHAGRLSVKGRLASFSEQGARVAMDSTLDIYTSFFKLTDRPFALLPDPDFIYWSAAHQQAYSMLEYGLVTRAPITLILPFLESLRPHLEGRGPVFWTWKSAREAMAVRLQQLDTVTIEAVRT